jgi:hypothetical protein
MSFMSPEILRGRRGVLVMDDGKNTTYYMQFRNHGGISHHFVCKARKRLGGENEKKEKETRDTHENQLAPTMVLR